MSNETVDVALCEYLSSAMDRAASCASIGPSTFADLQYQFNALLAERTRLHAVIAELVRVERALMAADGSWNISEDTFAWQRAFDVADGEAK